jgi:hypothetical protein
MSIEKILLRKLLRLIYLPDNKRTSLLRADIRSDLKKTAGETSEGGDFHGPFWTDAKNHVAGIGDLRSKIKQRVDRNKGRKRLYDLLGNGFLQWWDEKRRWRNVPFEVLPESVKAQLLISELGGTIKIENLLALKIGDQSHRIIYPYFSEEPALPEEGRRIGLSVLNKGLVDYSIDDLRILDVLRGSSYGILDHALQGNENELLLRRYGDVLKEWKKLKKEYA